MPDHLLSQCLEQGPDRGHHIANTGSSARQRLVADPHRAHGQTITNGRNATNASYNATIPPAGYADIGYQATNAGNSGRAGSFTLNGEPREAAR